MLVRDVMDPKCARIHLDRPMRLAAEILVLTEDSDLVVIDEAERYVGVLSEGDLLHALMPDFEGLLESGASLARASQAFLDAGAALGDQPIARLVIRDPITLSPDDDLLTAATVLVSQGIRRLAVVDDAGRFVGSLSRADLCWAVLVEQPRRAAAQPAAAGAVGEAR